MLAFDKSDAFTEDDISEHAETGDQPTKGDFFFDFYIKIRKASWGLPRINNNGLKTRSLKTQNSSIIETKNCPKGYFLKFLRLVWRCDQF